MERTKEDWARIVDFQDDVLRNGTLIVGLLASSDPWRNGVARVILALADWDTATFRRIHRKYVQAARGV